jgi:hypothetical protein
MWRASIYADVGDGKSKNRYLGSFEDEVEAALAYDQAASEYHGDRAQLNFPEPLVEPQAALNDLAYDQAAREHYGGDAELNFP